ncbi:MAG TPA: c-type cytochrome [Blastocatellia bacterium]|nr:c-type cytochrome [Blastocatellia bacterium]
MKFLKSGLVVSLAVLFYAACTATETTNRNASSSANQNVSSPTASVTPAADANANTPGRPGANSAASGTDGAALFKANNCAACHGEDGKGNPTMKAKMKDLPDFTDAAWQKKTTDADMIETIKNGHKPMPAYKDKLNDDQIKAVVAYVRTFAK